MQMLRHILFSLSIILIISGLGLADSSKLHPVREKICESFPWNYECNKRVEDEFIKLYPKLINRDGNVLTVFLKNGKNIKRVCTRPRNTEIYDYKSPKYYDYYFYNYFADAGYFLLLQVLHELNKFELINAFDGFNILLDGPPTFSPNKKRIVVNVNPDWDDKVHRIEIWKIINNKFIKEFSISPENWPSLHISWKNDNQLVLKEGRWSRELGKYGTTIIGNIYFQNNNWILKEK
jgi:hypothetical protein